MKLTNYLPLALLVVCGTLFSCSENDVVTNPTANLTKVAEGEAPDAGARVELWANEELFVGYNPIFVALYDIETNERITHAHISLTPLMTMATMSHACPAENPSSEEAVNSLFPASVTFIMPSGDMGSWKLTLTIHNHISDKEGSVNLDVVVNNPEVSRLKSFVTETGDKYFVAYNFPSKTKVGVNDVAFMVYKKETMMSFPGVEDFAITMEPEMPSMGHGSPNNVNPVHQVNGRYAGKVNFTMTGDWRLNLTFTKGTLAQDVFFDVTLD